jgi:hypothetical protein
MAGWWGARVEKWNRTEPWAGGCGLWTGSVGITAGLIKTPGEWHAHMLPGDAVGEDKEAGDVIQWLQRTFQKHA